MNRFAAGLCCALFCVGCASTVALSPQARGRLRTTEQVPVAYVRSPSPQAECTPGDPDRLWTGASAGSVYTWDEFREAATAVLRAHPPEDPARATREALLGSLSGRGGPASLRNGGGPVESAGARDLGRRFGGVAVLVLETRRFVLLGCYLAYRPWFNVRATLVDARDGAVLWRQTCGRRYPRDRRDGASPNELLADGEKLYARMMEARAAECAAELFAGLQPPLRR